MKFSLLFGVLFFLLFQITAASAVANPIDIEKITERHFEGPLIIKEDYVNHTFKEVSGKLNAVIGVKVDNVGDVVQKSVKVNLKGDGINLTKTISSIGIGTSGYASFQVLATETMKLTVSLVNVKEDGSIEYIISSKDALPDISIKSADITHTPITLKTGNKAVIKANIHNLGPITAKNVKVIFKIVSNPNDYKIDGTTGWVIGEEKGGDIDGQVIGEFTAASIAGNGKKPISVTVVIPPAMKSLPIAVTVDSSKTINELSEQNNRAIIEIPVQDIYAEIKLSNSSVTFSKKNPTIGESVAIKVNVSNSGALYAKNVPLSFYASIDGKNYQLIGTKNISTIIGNGKGYASLSWTIPNGASSINFLVNANQEHSIIEKNYSNNMAYGTLNTSLPDFVLSGDGINVSGDMAIGKKVTIKALIKNEGSADAKSTDVLFYYIPSSGTEKYIGTGKISAKAGLTGSVSISWTVPSDISSKQTIIARINPNKTLTESSYGNNQGTYTGSIRLPDLTVEMHPYPANITLSSNPEMGSGARMVITVTNAGTDIAKNIKVIVLYNGINEKNETINSLVSGASYQFGHWHYLKYGSAPGSYSFKVIVDPENTVNEAVETNNEATAATIANANRPPVAAIVMSNTTPMKRQWVDFSCMGSSDPDSVGLPFCEWRFDGAIEADISSEPTHYFMTSGAHAVKLTVMDQYGLSTNKTDYVNVLSNRPPAVYSGGTITAYRGSGSTLSVQCSDIDGEISSASWSFGDGQSGTSGCDITHTYSNNGNYNFAVTVTDDNGATASTTGSVIVIEPPQTLSKTFSDVYVAHYWNPEIASSGDGPDSKTFYGLYRVDYEVNYTGDTITQLKYKIYSGPGIVEVISDNPEFYMPALGAASGQGGTSLTVTSIKIQEGSVPIWTQATESFLSPAESPMERTFTGLNIQVDWSKHNYFVISSTIEFPGQMCTGEGYNCQYQSVLWPMS